MQKNYTIDAMTINENEICFLEAYLQRYQRSLLDEGRAVFPLLGEFRDIARSVRETGCKLMFAGNGASASISSHLSVDFTKQGRVRAVDFNEASLITCYSNDFGYENWVAEAVKAFGDDGDVLVLISSSGTSPNVVKAGEYAKSRGMRVVTFSGFASDNALRQLGDVSFWVNSRSYNVIECTHMVWGTMAIDLLIGEVEYSVS